MAEVQQKITITVPRSFNSTQRIQVADLALERIRERSSQGKRIDGKAFKGYSDSYKQSKDFEIAGKSRTVNLRLSGEMMLDIELLGHGTGFVVLGFESGSFSNDKASFAVNSTVKGAKKRPFLGLNGSELEEIINQVKRDETETQVRGLLEAARRDEEGAPAASVLGSFLRNILGGG